MKKEYFAYTPLEVYQAIRTSRRDIAFDGFPNKVYFDEEEHIANIHVSTRLRITRPWMKAKSANPLSRLTSLIS